MAEFWRIAISNLSLSNLSSPLVVFDEHNAEYILQRSAYESDARRVTRWHAALLFIHPVEEAGTL